MHRLGSELPYCCGMTELQIIQLPITAIDVVTNPWQAYFLSFLQIDVALFVSSLA